ncbi:MAG: galactose-1-phosphate uridylyltransferase [Leptolyngbyaceae cyanobacterium bins.59]|nr:galactose-1-phosphate uridylyltransferase [Leptolyngbyaceae cyanobacterium bins.59]
MSHSHIRLNRATREWVIYAPNRRKRPQDFQWEHTDASQANSAKSCPFCKETFSSEETVLLEVPNSAGTDWQVRVVPNKFPALSPELEPRRSLSGIYLELPGYGHHEVLIETPEHHQVLALMPCSELERVVEAYRLRYQSLMKIRENLWIIIFRNQGRIAGSSLRHPHSQLMTTPIVPRHRRWHEDEAQRYFDEWGQCAYCDILEFERYERRRVIAENESYLAFIPFAAEVPFEIWILPKEHQSEFGAITPEQVSQFAAILKTVLLKLYQKLNNPDYNYAILTAARYRVAEPHNHWYCQIRPRLTTPAGFEIGSGISINPSLPEADADFLNED